MRFAQISLILLVCVTIFILNMRESFVNIKLNRNLLPEKHTERELRPIIEQYITGFCKQPVQFINIWIDEELIYAKFFFTTTGGKSWNAVEQIYTIVLQINPDNSIKLIKKISPPAGAQSVGGLRAQNAIDSHALI